MCPATFTRCTDEDCPCGGSLFHCYLCSLNKKGTKEGVLIKHFEKKHWNQRVSHNGRVFREKKQLTTKLPFYISSVNPERSVVNLSKVFEVLGKQTGKWTQVELAYRFALGGQTDSQVSTEVHLTRKKRQLLYFNG